MDNIICEFEGCDNVCDNDALVVTQNNKVVCALCLKCLRGTDKLRLQFSRPTEYFELEEMLPLSSTSFTR